MRHTQNKTLKSLPEYDQKIYLKIKHDDDVDQGGLGSVAQYIPGVYPRARARGSSALVAFYCKLSELYCILLHS